MSRDMQNEARVFAEGDVTIVINRQTAAARIYAGTQLIGFVQKLRLELDMQAASPQLDFIFPQSFNTDVDLRVEEQMRAVKQQVPWANVTR